MAALPALGVLVCTRIGSYQPGPDSTPVVSWAVDGWELVFVPCHFLVSVVRPFWSWRGCSGVNLLCLQCGCLWLDIDAELSIM